MHKIKRILRLSHEAGRTQREIARACGLSQPLVRRVLKAAREAGWHGRFRTSWTRRR